MANMAKATEAGNRQRAFKDGVEHLGNDKSSVRQGGAHTLFHLALEDDKLRAPIAGILCAHIRETTGNKGYQEQNQDKPSVEMQSLLGLLFMETGHKRRLVRFWKGIKPNLEGGYFCGAQLGNAQFRGAKLDSAQFQKASLWLAQFQGASLEEAQFQGASLGGARFQWASLAGAQFQWASLLGARFQDAVLGEAQFQGALLEEAQFQGAWMAGTRFHVADLQRTQFQGTVLTRAQFQGALLYGSQFQGASLYKTEFQQAKFGAKLEYEDILRQGYATAEIDNLIEQSKTSAFHGVYSKCPNVHESFEARIRGRTNEQSDFSEVIFFGGVAEDLLMKVKAVLEVPAVDRALISSDVFNDSAVKEELIRNLESEIRKPESNAPSADVTEDSYSQEDAERWIREYSKSMKTTP